MNRLILLLGPIGASLGGVGLATAIRWALRQWIEGPPDEGKASKGAGLRWVSMAWVVSKTCFLP